MTSELLSLPQLFGYATFSLGLITFSRKNDGHFKNWLTAQNLLYATHFFLMGNTAAMAGALLSAARNVISMRTRSVWAIAALLAINLALGAALVRSAWSALPLLAAAVATVSMFRFSGLQLRYGMLGATLLWLLNNIHTGSIGGTVMESMITVVSCITIHRLRQDRKLGRSGRVRELSS
ncbi:MAG: YgjV family protein [Candidatus Dactylopiibacterium sp.]|nr:YgjV family protein [Candidatus Dactylopiibacterium sp.]